MPLLLLAGIISWVLSGALFYWGTLHPTDSGYGLPILFLLSLSITVGLYILKESKQKAHRTVAWFFIGLPVLIIVLFFVFVIGLLVGAMPE